ncbi:glycine cleavage system protein GcvH [Azospirillum sp. YIM DDC1]|uniref:Glycine cleavage system H protein n=1 Tax=Azospirillum aestuarii TaxID=2802052 RepID=A0ABS1HZA8_9PROT|nr:MULTISPECIES: glycine cleavage system protein GcvH [Azospirillum]MBK3776973.1 glycine cleavage system protein GcvH [Azospirillum brasilense]AWJ84917.1 glycine cleavage system protein H [Azospirillum sp. TSH58]MBK4720141.1 glycine cleavage system protein GcvH [Azospirillum aestuarii]PWC65962.1 glycine cleavage system protein H [Azospirillum sp. TSH58]TWA88440.1 glycine cleavage system H protein [Azospirillum brasilense]
MTIKYTKDHEWVRVEGDIGTVGVSDHAQHQLGDVVFVELPDVGRQLAQGKEAAVVESVKAASDVFAPVSGEVIEANADLENDPSLVNAGAETTGWFFKLRLSNPSELDGLMDEAAYKAFVEGQA